ncbi:hypothetical protein [Rhizobium sp. MHM7A]|uniref:hypothetical protein n=1 Tax=Rhizobium sp. MHM7A TaxID=2583233 RepID=UPI0014870611|nr:hypothetical protein [Rhizobium sp. MHM7A]
MLNYDRAADNFPSAQDFVTFNRVVNIMDLGTAADDCASAFQSVFGSDTAAATAAWDFKDSVKFQIVLNEAGLITEADVAWRSSQDWDTIHVYFLTQAEDAFFKLLSASKAKTSPELSEAIDAFRKKIEAGRRLEIALV